MAAEAKKHPGRKPVHLISAGRKPGGRQAIWAAIRANRDGFTVISLAKATKTHRDTVRSYIMGLLAGGYIMVGTTDGPIPVAVFRLVNDVGVDAPRVTKDGKPVTQGAGREQMWRTMRMIHGDFSWRDLAIAASTAAVSVSEEDAKDYCANLAKAGYLIVAAKGKAIGGGLGKGGTGIPTRYRFVPAKYTGPKPPMVQRVSSVFDPNLGKIVWTAEVRHDD